MERGRERKRRKKPTETEIGRVVSIFEKLERERERDALLFLALVLLCSVHLSGLFITGRERERRYVIASFRKFITFVQKKKVYY